MLTYVKHAVSSYLVFFALKQPQSRDDIVKHSNGNIAN